MTNSELLNALEQEVRSRLKDAEKGHDWQHINRVRKTAVHLQSIEGGDAFVIELAALLHDIDDAKFNGGKLQAGAQTSRQILEPLGVAEDIIFQVAYLVENCSFKGGQADVQEPSLELQILRDADRLDAIGAIGIARTFHYGGYKNQAIYDPDLAVRDSMSPESYYQDKTSTINHFYEKLLKLKAGMNTATAKKMAAQRHAFMELFLQQFFNEWHQKMESWFWSHPSPSRKTALFNQDN